MPFHLTGRGITTRPMGQADGNPIFCIDAARFSGKVSPVHHFWHTFDLAHTRFSGRHVDQSPTVDPVTREAYSREVASFGFWFGDDRFAEPAFYAYVAPEPAGLAEEPPRPAAAWWDPRDGSHLAVLRYADARACSDPRLTRDARRGQRRACPEPSVGIHIERDDRTR